MRNRIIRKIDLVLIINILLSGYMACSQTPAGCDLKFVAHLVNAGYFDEALFVLDSTDCRLLQANDSADFYRGWSRYSLKSLETSPEYLLKVSPQSGFFLKSRYFAAYNYTHTGNYSRALEILSRVDGGSAENLTLNNFEKAGIYLLMGDTANFREKFAITGRSHYGISKSYDDLLKVAADLKEHKAKSPCLAGVLSGVIPGSGKFYAGRKGEAVSAFIGTAGLGLVTFENYRKKGLKGFSTLAFGTLFAFTYASNIYGAVVSARLAETEYQTNVKNTILFNLHIPLRVTFDN